MSTITAAATASEAIPEVATWRLNLMRAGYVFMFVGLAIVKWPLLPDAHTMPFFESVVVCMLTAMSLLALLGLRYPIKLLPVLLFETLWKVLWLSLVALPRAVDHQIDSSWSEKVVNCSLVVVIIAVIPWGYVWRTYVQAPGERWR